MKRKTDLRILSVLLSITLPAFSLIFKLPRNKVFAFNFLRTSVPSSVRRISLGIIENLVKAFITLVLSLHTYLFFCLYRFCLCFTFQGYCIFSVAVFLPRGSDTLFNYMVLKCIISKKLILNTFISILLLQRVVRKKLPSTNRTMILITFLIPKTLSVSISKLYSSIVSIVLGNKYYALHFQYYKSLLIKKR